MMYSGKSLSPLLAGRWLRDSLCCWAVSALPRELKHRGANLDETWVSAVTNTILELRTFPNSSFSILNFTQLYLKATCTLIWNNLSFILQTPWKFYYLTLQAVLPAKRFLAAFFYGRKASGWVNYHRESNMLTLYFPLSSSQSKMNVQPLFEIISRGLLGEFWDFHVALAFDQNFPALPCLILAIWIKRLS